MQERVHVVAAERGGNDLLAEVDAVSARARRAAPGARRRRCPSTRRTACPAASAETARRRAASRRSRPAARRSASPRTPTIWPVAIEAEDAHLGRIARRHRLRGNRDVGAALGVRLDQLARSPSGRGGRRRGSGSSRRRSCSKCRRACRTASAVPWNQFALSGVCSAARISTKPSREHVEPVGLADVTVERRRVELRQHEDAADVRVQAAADRDVDEAVLAADRYCRLRPGVRREERAGCPARHRG